MIHLCSTLSVPRCHCGIWEGHGIFRTQFIVQQSSGTEMAKKRISGLSETAEKKKILISYSMPSPHLRKWGWLGSKYLSVHPEHKLNPAPWTENTVTAMCFPKKVTCTCCKFSNICYFKPFLFNIGVFHMCIQWVLIKSINDSLRSNSYQKHSIIRSLSQIQKLALTHWV